MIRTLLSLLPADSRRTIAAHLALTTLGVVLRAVGVVLLIPLVAGLFGDEPGRAWPWLGALALVTTTGWAVDAAAARHGFALGFGLLDTGQRTVADRIADIRLTWFTAENVATSRQAIAATGPDLVGLVIYLVTPLLNGILLPVAISVALIPVSWQLGLAALAGVPVLLAAFWASGRLGRDADRAAATTNSALTERIMEFARTQQALRAARRAEPARSHAGAALSSQHGASVRLLLLQVPGQLVFGLAGQLALLLLAGTTVTLTVRGTLTPPEAVALIVVVVRYLEPFTTVAELSPGVESCIATLRRIRSVLDAPANSTGTRGTRYATPAAPPRIELRKVTFGYDGTGTPPVLDGLDLVLEPGTTTALVGPSGSGKSTVLALLAGLYRPASGSVLIDGADCATLDARSRRALVSAVFQDPYLFDGTVRDNILAGAPEADDDAVERAACLARADIVVRRLPDGWASRVGEAGTTLSGGERQRVSIARALLKPAPVLLIDEATSALDSENEAAVTGALTTDPLPRTKVIVAHRLASIRTADRVVFLEEGRVVEDGPVDELLATGGRFADFWQHQDSAGTWRLSAPRPELRPRPA
ncbi:ABC transporter ATP-binding protein [Streptomyces sp. CMSTAAHL-2]|uniref:ABC transporter ATP-binding protein n=1 Tax=Streptomyces sp. CMSTAAHL-2 TaxID=2904522 RepID=UPI001E59F3FA|nr:ABC transporter ATP-binding protein [Streptomyces sp. CMSTAAHL-2]MCE3029563.1 ABC transporter ATP-binding protein/permease [Streptomyces sp. CMSTAAHL-2]